MHRYDFFAIIAAEPRFEVVRRDRCRDSHRDLVAEVFCHNLGHPTELITQRILVVPGVRSTETLMIARSHKLAYRWAPDLEFAFKEEWLNGRNQHP